MTEDKFLDLFKRLSREIRQADDNPHSEQIAGATKKVGPYLLLDKVGEGASGTVFRAWHPELRRFAAIKFLARGDESSRARFLREARISARLRHPGIVTVHEVGEYEEQPYIAMEFVEGVTFDQAPWTVRDALLAVRYSAEAIQHAHEQGVIHRDLKPSNIMLGSDGKPRVADFGLARFQKSGETLTRTGGIAGTPAFMAPEAVKGARPDARTDVYGLGATLYSLLVGEPPYTGSTVADVLQRVMNSDPEPIGRRLSTLNRDVALIIEKSMAREPERRYGSARAFAEDIDRYLNGEAIEARPPSMVYRVRKWVARRRVLVVAILGVAAVGALLPWLFAARRDLEREKLEKREKELYLTVERELELHRRNFYVPDFGLDDADFLEYEDMQRRVREFMNETTETPRGWNFIGRCRHVLSDLAGAEAAYDRALELQADHVDSLIGKARLFTLHYIHAMVDSKTDPKWVKGVRDRRKKELIAHAEDLRERLRAYKPESRFDIAVAKGHLLLLYGREHLQGYCDRMMARWKGEAFNDEFLLIKALAAPDREERRMAAEAAVGERPGYYQAHFVHGLMYFGSDHRKALAAFDKAARIHPRYAPTFYHRARVRAALGQVKGALQDYDRFLELRTEDAMGFYQRGRLHGVLQDFTRGIEDLTRAIDLSEDNWEAYEHRAGFYVNLAAVNNDDARLDDAERDIEETIRIHPDCYEAYLLRGVINSERKRGRDLVIRDWETALRNAPPDWSKRKTVTVLLARLRKRD